MTRKEFLLSTLFAPAAALAQQGVPTNLDQHGEDMPAGMDMASDMAMQANAVSAAPSTVNVSTRSGGNLRHGVYQDTILTPDSVTKNPPRKQFTIVLPGDKRGLEGQPLIARGVTVADGSVHDVIVSPTMANLVYAHDANTGEPLWMVRLGRPIVGTTKIDGWKINDKWGILSTGQLDGNLLYVVSWSSPDGTAANAFHRFHVISLRDGSQPKPAIPLTKPGAVQRKQRASLSMIGSTVYIPAGTIQETSTNAHGFVTAIDTVAWKVTREWNATPGGSGAGIWMAGQGASSDGKFLYVLTGNGTYDPAKGCYGESFVKLDLALNVVDHYAPWRDADRGKGGGWDDMDLGSGGCLVIPELGLLLGAGKDGILYVLNKDNLKAGPVQKPIFFTFNGLGLDSTPANIKTLNQLYYGVTHHMHATPIYWNGKLICWGENGNGRLWSIDKTGKVQFLARTSEIASPYSPKPPGGMPGSMMCLSANGNSNGILWASVPDEDANRKVTTGRIFAFDMQAMGGKMADGDTQLKRLWMSDPHHTFNKFLPPLVWNGRIYMGTYDGTIEVWG